jgi:hypothetical protein
MTDEHFIFDLDPFTDKSVRRDLAAAPDYSASLDFYKRSDA